MNIRPGDFDYIRAIVRDANGVTLGEEKSYLAELRLLPLATAAGCSSITELIAAARASDGRPLRKQITDAMTTGETQFFRDLRPFQYIRDRFLPEIAARDTDGDIVIWCAACSTGQEPYSVAMIVDELQPQLRGRKVRLIASDVSTAVLDRARAGVYAQHEINRGLPASLLVRHFSPVAGGKFQVAERLQRRVEFIEHSLFDSWDAFPPVDLLVLRNVLIYFSLEDKQRVLERAARQIKPGGLLLLGGPETTLGLTESFVPHRVDDIVVFRTTADHRRARTDELFSKIWRTMIGWPLERLSDDVSTDPTFVGGTVEITGAWVGRASVAMSPELARRITQRLLSSDAVDTADIADALGELANTFGGNIKSAVPAPTQLSLPRPWKRSTTQARLPGDAIVNFSCLGHRVQVQLLETPRVNSAP